MVGLHLFERRSLPATVYYLVVEQVSPVLASLGQGNPPYRFSGYRSPAERRRLSQARPER